MVESGDGGARIDEPFTPKSLLSPQNQSLQFKNAVTLQPFCLFLQRNTFYMCVYSVLPLSASGLAGKCTPFILS